MPTNNATHRNNNTPNIADHFVYYLTNSLSWSTEYAIAPPQKHHDFLTSLCEQSKNILRYEAAHRIEQDELTQFHLVLEKNSAHAAQVQFALLVHFFRQMRLDIPSSKILLLSEEVIDKKERNKIVSAYLLALFKNKVLSDSDYQFINREPVLRSACISLADNYVALPRKISVPRKQNTPKIISFLVFAISILLIILSYTALAAPAGLIFTGASLGMVTYTTSIFFMVEELAMSERYIENVNRTVNTVRGSSLSDGHVPKPSAAPCTNQNEVVPALSNSPERNPTLAITAEPASEVVDTICSSHKNVTALNDDVQDSTPQLPDDYSPPNVELLPSYASLYPQ